MIVSFSSLFLLSNKTFNSSILLISSPKFCKHKLISSKYFFVEIEILPSLICFLNSPSAFKNLLNKYSFLSGWN